MVKITLLGTGIPTPNPDRMGSCIAIEINQKPILFDCGRSAVTQMTRAGLDPSMVEYVFLTHHHFDHTVGLPDLLLGSWMTGRDTEINIFGPTGTSDFVKAVLEAFKIDITARKESRGNRPGAASKLEVIAKDFVDGLIFQNDEWKVRAVKVDHLPGAVGFRLDTADRSVVFSGDTKPSQALTELAEGADLLIHEVFFSPELEATGAPVGRKKQFVNPQWAQRVRHTKPHEVSKLASQAGVKRLALTHLWSSQNLDRLREIVAKDFSGEIIIGQDLLSLEI